MNNVCFRTSSEKLIKCCGNGVLLVLGSEEIHPRLHTQKSQKSQHKTNSTILDDSYSKTQLYSLLCSYLVTRTTLAHKTWNEIKRDSTRYGPGVLRIPSRSVTHHPVHILRCRLVLSRHCEHPRWTRNLQAS